MTSLSFPSNSIQSEKEKSRDVLIVCRTFFPHAGGIEEYVYNRCLQNSDRIIVLTSEYRNSAHFDQLQVFPIYRWPSRDWSRFGYIGSLLKQVSYLFWSFIMSLKLYSKYHYESIEWCHGYDFISLYLLKKFLPVKSSIYLHGDDILCPLRNPILKVLFNRTLSHIDNIVCASNFPGKLIKENFTSQKSIHLINPTVRPEKFHSRNNGEIKSLRHQYGIPDSSIVILSVGRLVKRKGFNRIIEYLPRLIEQEIDVHYLICGKGNMEEELKHIAQKYNVENRVHFAGYVADENLASYYETCDIFSMLTFLDNDAKSIEGFGIVYLEAGYFKKPVLACRVGGVEDAVKHNESGLLADPESNEEIFASLYKLCKNRELREQLGQGGYNLAIRKVCYEFLNPNS